jgi:hypothetical protein
VPSATPAAPSDQKLDARLSSNDETLGRRLVAKLLTRPDMQCVLRIFVWFRLCRFLAQLGNKALVDGVGHLRLSGFVMTRLASRASAFGRGL